MSAQQLEQFFTQFQQAFTDNSFQRLVLSKYKGDEAELERITVRPVQIKTELLLSFLYEYRSKHITKNLSLTESMLFLQNALGSDFNNSHLLTREWEIQLSFSKKGKVLLNKHRNKQTVITDKDAGLNHSELTLSHNKPKQRYVEQSRPYLRELGITDSSGQVIPAMSRKWKQINKFIEVLSGAIEKTQLSKRQQIHIADFGSGKAYLTFAVHDYLTAHLHLNAKVTGVELRQSLVDLCNATAQKLQLPSLHFEQGDVKHFAAKNIDVMIALHACDIATDYAIHMGIRTGADIIMCSPCCHKQIRPQLKSPKLLSPLLQHGIHLGQEAEMLTDGLRALLLEAHGYDTQVFEFISLEHTSKNKMILAQKRSGHSETSSTENAKVLQQISEIKTFYGIKEHCLETLLQMDATQ